MLLLFRLYHTTSEVLPPTLRSSQIFNSEKGIHYKAKICRPSYSHPSNKFRFLSNTKSATMPSQFGRINEQSETKLFLLCAEHKATYLTNRTKFWNLVAENLHEDRDIRKYHPRSVARIIREMIEARIRHLPGKYSNRGQEWLHAADQWINMIREINPDMIDFDDPKEGSSKYEGGEDTDSHRQ